MKTDKMLEFVNAKISELENVKYWIKLQDAEYEIAELKDEIASLKDVLERLEPLKDKARDKFIRSGIDLTLYEIEREVILARFKYFEGNKMKTAASLGLTIKTLYNKLGEYGE